jgi:hypothetical protein
MTTPQRYIDAPADVGESCIRFNHPEDIDLDVLAQTIRAGAKAVAKQIV